eukprot:1145488-Pelagomonas_calceolata.AAC.3
MRKLQLSREGRCWCERASLSTAGSHDCKYSDCSIAVKEFANATENFGCGHRRGSLNASTEVAIWQ